VSITQILALVCLAALLGLLRRGRSLALLGFGVLVIYWIQPPSPVFPSLSFWLPTLTVFLAASLWAITAPPEARSLRGNWPALAVLLGAILLEVLTGRLPHVFRILPTAPSIFLVGGGLAVFLVLMAGLLRLRGGNRFLLFLGGVGILAVFILLKAPWLSQQLLALAGNLRGRELDPTLKTSLAWLGYSYVAFRLLHTIRDRQSGLLPAVGLAEYVNYVIFFPAFTAGPIDRLERFVKELREPLPLKNDDWLFAGGRLAWGLFKKFFIADLLALVSITDLLVDQTRSGGWLWFVLYAYALRLYFDFSGYTDIAIGMGRLMGIRLPENFNAPFLKPNLTQLWNSWHMTLTQWFRAYFFNPLTRFLRTRKRPLSPGLIILLTQVSAMLLIGLWHGVTVNFALWGLWHGLGLFVQNRWSEFMRVRFPNLGNTPFWRNALPVGGVFLTFSYFSLGLVFFALSTPQIAFAALLKLFGMA
jgi:D-alanyl-lipoteichoic acid acyltransferase DltB (MBOAT superfamily)